MNCQHEFVTLFSLCTLPPVEIQKCRLCGEDRTFRETMEKGISSDMKCDICGTSMAVSKFKNQTVFTCEKSDCNQVWDFSEDGNSSCTVLKSLWGKMDENSKQYREEYIPARRLELEYYPLGMFISGYWNEEKYNERMSEINRMFEEWYENHPLVEKKGFWKNLFGFLR